jgi:REP element-mobilizing transposase RayT
MAEEELNRFGVEVLAWCLMTNHTHWIVVPKDSAVLARAVGEAHRRDRCMRNCSDGVRGYLCDPLVKDKSLRDW